MKKNLLIICALVILTGCEKEIDLGYRSVEKVYVVEGHLTNEKTEVMVSFTRDMEDSVKARGTNVTRVMLSGDDGSSEILEYEADGYYRSPSGFTGTLGINYTLRVQAGDDEFVSTSKMYGETQLDSMTFQWQTMMDNKFLFCVFEIQDIADETNYYCYRMYRNGKIYSWDVFDDKGNEDQVIKMNVFCVDEERIKDNKREEWDEILYENDVIVLEVQTIDRRAYDYLYSLGLSERTSTNPIDNFSGGCLGYFSAHSSISRSMVFHFDEVE